MFMSLRLSCSFFLLALAFQGPNLGSATAEDGFQEMFNGKDLAGWVPVNTAPSTWTVKDGMLICSGKPIGELRTEIMYQNFVLELEWRHMVPKGNSGVFVWADDITARGQPFHRGIEVQVLENAYGNSRNHTTHGDIFPIHGAVMTPINGRRGSRAFPTKNLSKASPQWNSYRIVCDQGNISLAVNGEVVTKGTDCSPSKGYICLESEGGVVHFRNVRIKKLPDTAIDSKDVAIANRGYKSLYTGVDLSGWKATAPEDNDWKSKDWVLTNEGKPDWFSSPLETVRDFGDIGFIFDVRLQKNSGKPVFTLRGSDNASFEISQENKAIGEHLEPTRKWNRFEGTIRANLLTLSLNGHEIFRDRPISAVHSTGPLKISPDGPVDFANIYVRPLD